VSLLSEVSSFFEAMYSPLDIAPVITHIVPLGVRLRERFEYRQTSGSVLPWRQSQHHLPQADNPGYFLVLHILRLLKPCPEFVETA
jgi:hypothetical protein